jgi:hypothetical protein
LKILGLQLTHVSNPRSKQNKTQAAKEETATSKDAGQNDAQLPDRLQRQFTHNTWPDRRHNGSGVFQNCCGVNM